MISSGNRMRFSKAPPHSSERLLVRGSDKLVDQVAFAAHDFHPVVAGFAGQRCRTGKIGDRGADEPRLHFPGSERRNARPDRELGATSNGCIP
jgi:hypothetical protein